MVMNYNLNRMLFLLILSMAGFVAFSDISVTRDQSDDASSKNKVDWPESYASSWAQAFFNAFNSENEGAMRSFIEARYSEAALKKEPFDEVLAAYRHYQKMLGKLHVHSTRGRGEYAIEVIAKSDAFGWVKIPIALSSDPPHDLTEMKPALTSAPDDEANKAYEDWNDLSDLVECVMRDSGAPGMVAAVVRKGEIVDQAAAGVRRIDKADCVQITDRFHIGSVTKSFTATLIGKLVEEGGARLGCESRRSVERRSHEGRLSKRNRGATASNAVGNSDHALDG